MMNREIKFRGKAIDSGKWVEGFYLTRKPFLDVRHYIFVMGSPNTQYEVKPETVGQYTGLQDRNGKDVFEGDIIKFQDLPPYYNPLNYVVEFNVLECKYVITWRRDGKDVYGNRKLITSVQSNVVISNIHDNPELLK